MKIGNIDIKGKIVIAPLAGYTNKVYRTIMKQMGANLVYSEMISAKGLLYDNDKTWFMTEVDVKEHPVSVQLFGYDIDEMVRAAQLLDRKSDCDIIDINMGCPVKKVLRAQSGSYLMQYPEHIEAMVSSIVQVVKKPVTVKIRGGWNKENINCIDVARRCERAGASAIAIHGRLKTDLYRGVVNLDYIKDVKASVSIPVIGNGDINTVDDALNMLAYTSVDAVMIGRGTLGNPWLVAEIDAHLNNHPYTPPTKQEKVAMLLHHFDELVQLKGEKVAILEMRSLAAWYVKGFENNKVFKQKLVHVQTRNAFLDLVKIYCE